ncbi:MAG: VOC family protein [Nannocystales bacterium]
MNYTPQHFTVWAEIPVTDMERAIAFYRAATGAELNLDTSGPNPIAIFKPENPETGVAGNLYPGKPAGNGHGPTVHLAAAGSIEAISKRVKDAGGTHVSDPITIPAGRFFYAQDPDGNSVGFFEERLPGSA